MGGQLNILNSFFLRLYIHFLRYIKENMNTAAVSCLFGYVGDSRIAVITD